MMDSRVKRTIKVMNQSLNAHLTENELARQVGLTAQHFCVLFKIETGETPGRYLQRLRLDRARELLQDDESYLSVKEIAARVGCHDISHFVRDFEKRFGLSPRRYRKASDHRTAVKS